MSNTVDYGIYLGTTNSVMAKVEGEDTVIVPNKEGMNHTFSAVHIDKKGKIHVGRRAKNQLESDPENSYSEFKLSMGQDKLFEFKRSGIIMRPEELSAEILKSLRKNALQRYNEDIRSVVIAVPATFNLAENYATKKAAELAGFTDCTLITEPVAAAFAYDYEKSKERKLWLIYDLGGGTFNGAIIRLQDGALEVLEHVGDRALGGKLVDWDIVNKILVPKVIEEFNLTDFQRSNKKYIKSFAKLKAAAEQAKIELSKEEEAEIYIENLLDGEFEYSLTKNDLREIMKPYISRSVNLCRKALNNGNLKDSDITNIILVGESSLNPIVQGALKEEFEIPLKFSIDPVTVVARGAALYAGTKLKT